MHKPRVPRIALAGVAAVLAVAGLTGCRTSPNVAAYVGDEQITVAELDAAIESRQEDEAVATFAENNADAFSRQVLSLLVGEQVYAAAAENWDVTVTDEQVDERIDTLIGDNDPDAVYAQLAAQGIGREDVFENVRQQLVRQGIAGAEGLDDQLSDEALEQRYEDNRDQYKEYVLGYIAVPDQATADAVLQQLTIDPASYPTVAAAYANQITLPQTQTFAPDDVPSALTDGVISAEAGTGFTVPVEGVGVVVAFVPEVTFQPFEDVRPDLEEAAASDIDDAARELVDGFRADLDVTVNPRYGVLEDQAVVPDEDGVVDILGGGATADPTASSGG